jgi:hypothetical protein
LLRYNLKPVPYGTTVRIAFGDPIARSPGDEELVTKQAETWIGETLDAWHANRSG